MMAAMAEFSYELSNKFEKIADLWRSVLSILEELRYNIINIIINTTCYLLPLLW